MCRAAINRRVTGNPDEWPLEWFARLYGPRKLGLSLGCGTGNLERAARRVGLCDSIVGVDASNRSLTVARERALEERIEGLSYVEADLNHLQLPRDVYDVVFIHQSLHHVGSLEKLLGRAARSLKTDGVLLLDEWTGPAISEWTATLLERPASLFAEVPRAWRRWSEFRPPVSVVDPTEAIRSSEILPTLNLFFEAIEVRPYGGHLVAPLTAELNTRVHEGSRLDAFIEKWLALEEDDLRVCPARSYHHVVVGKPRRGLDAVGGRILGFAGRVGLALRYRLPSISKRAWQVLKWLAGRHDPLVPPERFLWGGDDFRVVGHEFLRLFRDPGGIQQDDRVLDVGCGAGRMALPLTEFLQPPGTYDGFDVSRPDIAWCRKAYARRFPGFRFLHADVRNSEYNPLGGIDPGHFVFPYRDAAFNFVLATSLFTHLLPQARAQYVAEIARVLAPGGRCFLTAFLLNDRARSGIEAGDAAYGFQHEEGEARIEDPERPEASIAYDEQEFLDLLAQQGLSITSLRHGYWTGTPGLTFQDVVVCRKD